MYYTPQTVDYFSLKSNKMKKDIEKSSVLTSRIRGASIHILGIILNSLLSINYGCTFCIKYQYKRSKY
jgi:hypothetical protein